MSKRIHFSSSSSKDPTRDFRLLSTKKRHVHTAAAAAPSVPTRMRIMTTFLLLEPLLGFKAAAGPVEKRHWAPGTVLQSLLPSSLWRRWKGWFRKGFERF
jgi:hypothetical protein